MATKIPIGSLPANFLPDRGLVFPSCAPFFSSAIFPVPRRAVALRAVTASKPSAPPARKREPRGITKPRPISPELQDLVGVPEISRTQALKLIWAYIKQHNLQDPENKKIIVCDEKLKKLFGGKERVGFLEIPGLLNPHFGSTMRKYCRKHYRPECFAHMIKSYLAILMLVSHFSWTDVFLSIRLMFGPGSMLISYGDIWESVFSENY